MKNVCRVLLLVVLCPLLGRSEDAKEPSKYYRLNFVVQEVEGNKVINAREYSETARTGIPVSGSIRTSTQITLNISASQLQNYESQVSIDLNGLQEVNGSLGLHVNAFVQSFSQEETNSPPVVRNNKWSADVLLPLKKQTVIFSSDDLTSKHKMQLVLTATPIN